MTRRQSPLPISWRLGDIFQWNYSLALGFPNPLSLRSKGRKQKLINWDGKCNGEWSHFCLHFLVPEPMHYIYGGAGPMDSLLVKRYTASTSTVFQHSMNQAPADAVTMPSPSHLAALSSQLLLWSEFHGCEPLSHSSFVIQCNLWLEAMLNGMLWW